MSTSEFLSGVTIGVLGQTWRGTVTAWGSVHTWDASPSRPQALDWYVAADDRWHVPAEEPTVRQTCFEGTPVVETRVRIPQGDAVQRVYAVADHGGLTVIEVENDSPLPIAVAMSGMPMLSVRPPSEQPPQGIDLPAGTVVFPIGHRATLTVAIAHDRARTGVLPDGLPSALQVARGWMVIAERAGRLLLPDPLLCERMVSARCRLALEGPVDPIDHPVDALLEIDQLVRMGGVAADWMPDVADAVANLSRHRDDAFLAAALDGATRVCAAAGEDRALRDLVKVRDRLQPSDAALPRSGDGARLIAAVERGVATGSALLPHGMPDDWLGASVEVYGVPTGPRSTVSFAIRWHGERPAVLWECAGEPLALGAPAVAPDWSTMDAKGEALWPAPAGVRIPTAGDEGISFG